MRLNLGCSDQKIAGFIGVDRWLPPWATPENFMQADLRHSWPWADSSADHIRCHDIIEHLPDKIHTMNELHRVLKPGGTVEIVVPTTDGPGAWQDPTHCSYWNRNSFLYHTAGDPHYARFHEAYGVKGAFNVKGSGITNDSYGVTKLAIVLEAVKTFGQALDNMTAAPATVERGKFAFSIIHATARPERWREIYDAWLKSAAHPEAVEYNLVMDSKYFQLEDALEAQQSIIRPKIDRVTWFHNGGGRRDYVTNVNEGAANSTGDVLIVNADDQWPCEGWDEKLLASRLTGPTHHHGDFVIEVTTNTPTEHERGILVMPILSRERYERFGWVLFPQYESMFADNDFCAMARRDGVVIDARHLVFPHKHPLNGEAQWDEAYHVQNRGGAYADGERIFKARQAINFSGVPPSGGNVLQMDPPQRKVVVVCTPGDMFGMAWVNAWTQLALHLAGNYNLYHLMGYTSDAGINRTQMLKNISECQFAIDYILWIDDDNTLLPQQFEMLRADLDSHPELDAVAAWCWCGPNEQPANGIPAMVSCGALKDVELTEDGKDIKYCCGAPLNPKKMKEAASDLIEIGYSGFPAVLMRADLLRKAGKFPFNPFLDDRCLHGKTGEDLAFFARAWARGGAKYAVDRRIEIAHYKRRPTCPTSDPYVETEIQTEAVNVK